MKPKLRTILIGVTILFSILGLAVGIIYSPILDVDKVVVIGAPGRESEVLDAAKIKIGEPLLVGSITSSDNRVAGLPWVESARLERKLTGTARLIVRSRTPVAYARTPEGLVGLVDEEGIVVAIVPTPPPGVPEIKNAGSVPAPGQKISAPDLVKVAASLGPLGARVAEIAITDRQATLYLIAGPEVRFGGLDRLAEKAQSAEAALGAIGTKGFSYLDVRVPSGPVTG
jgi:cell division protein FtsQ